MKLAATSFVLRKSKLGISTVLLLASATALAQYPTGKPVIKKSDNPRAVAVLEWTGQPGKPSASRLIPITIYVDGQFQDGGLYMARPAPMTLESGTEYVLQQAGQPMGYFDIGSAGHATDSQFSDVWFGYGMWKPLPKPKPPSAALLASKPNAYVVNDGDSDTPHFAHRPTANNGSATKTSDKAKAPGTAKSSDAPVLVDRSGDAQSQPSSASKKTSNAEDAPIGADDPDRPTLRHRAEKPQQSHVDVNTPAVTGIGSPADANDPDRPHLHYGKPTGAEAAELDLPKLTGTPVHLQQMVAVSDATDRDPHVFTYTWGNLQQEQDAQSKLETLAQQAIAASAAAQVPAATTAKKPTPKHKPLRHSKTASAKTKTPALPQLQDVQFHTYSLSYSGDATMVLSAHTDGTGAQLKYVTLIATNDIYGNPQVLYKNVTDAAHLDQTPRMKLVDAVDADADGRAELLFELDGMRVRQFALYSVAAGWAQQIFATATLP
ncbi:MAG: hypothetical protein ACYC46_00870 [Acidobacteriaceae bacterium]